jgi:hypothetical protein
MKTIDSCAQQNKVVPDPARIGTGAFIGNFELRNNS